jgi:hypothetical protein
MRTIMQFTKIRVGVHAGYLSRLAANPFVSSEVETPFRGAEPHGISTALDANGVGMVM